MTDNKIAIERVPAVFENEKDSCNGCVLLGLDNCSEVLTQLNLESCHPSEEHPKGFIYSKKEESEIMTKKQKLITEAKEMFPEPYEVESLLKFAQHLEQELNKMENKTSEAYYKLSKKFLDVKNIFRQADMVAKKNKQAV